MFDKFAIGEIAKFKRKTLPEQMSSTRWYTVIASQAVLPLDDFVLCGSFIWQQNNIDWELQMLNALLDLSILYV